MFLRVREELCTREHAFQSLLIVLSGHGSVNGGLLCSDGQSVCGEEIQASFGAWPESAKLEIVMDCCRGNQRPMPPQHPMGNRTTVYATGQGCVAYMEESFLLKLISSVTDEEHEAMTFAEHAHEAAAELVRKGRGQRVEIVSVLNAEWVARGVIIKSEAARRSALAQMKTERSGASAKKKRRVVAAPCSNCGAESQLFCPGCLAPACCEPCMVAAEQVHAPHCTV